MKKFTSIAILFFLFQLNYAFAQQIGDFRSKASGNWEDFSTWQIYDGTTWNNAISGQVPGGTIEGNANNVYLEAGFTVTLTGDAACKDLHLNGAQDVIRINTGDFSLNIWGKMRTYSGIAPGTTDNTATGSGINEWINTGSRGRLKFRGTVDRTIFEVGEVSANARSAGWRLDFAFDQGVTGVCKTVVRCGHLEVTSGILNIMLISEGLAADGELRIAGDDYTAQPGNGVSGGTCIVKNGAVLKAFRLLKNNPTSAGNSLASFTLEEGATLIAKQNCIIPALAYNIQGLVKFESTTTQNFIGTGSKVDAVQIVNYKSIILGGTSAKILVNDVSVSNKLTLEGTATLNKGLFALSFGLISTLEYRGSALQITSDAEFPPTNGPTALIINNSNGVNLHGDRTISGLLTLASGILDLQDNHLTLGENSPIIAGNPSETNMIVTSGLGELRKIFNAPGNFFYPVGEITGVTEYTYAKITVTSADILDATTYVGVRVVDGDHSANNGIALDNISRYWGVSSNSINLKYDGIFQYFTSDVNGTEGDITSYKYDDETSLSNGIPLGRVNKILHRIIAYDVSSSGFITGTNLCDITDNEISYSDALVLCGTSILPSSITGTPATVLSSNPIYQWQQRINNGAWININTNGNSQDYNETSALTSPNTYSYRRIVSDPISCLATNINISDVITFTIKDAITGNQIEGDQTLIIGGNPNPFTEKGVLAGGNDLYTYQWQSSSNSGGPYSDIALADATTYTVPTGLYSNMFYVRKVISGECTSISNEVGITIITSNIPSKYISNIKIYPNPVTEIVNISLADISQKKTKVVLVDNQGTKLFEQDYNSGATNLGIDMSNFSTGLYFVQLSIDGKFVSTFKISKK